jgi:hypothetical protein
VVASTRATQKTTKRHVKGQFDSIWSLAIIRETCEESQQRIHFYLLVNLYWAINVENTCAMGRLKAREAR